MTAPTIKPDEIAGLIELRDVYDGWSVAVLHDGTRVNRWDPDTYPGRYAATEKTLAAWAAEDEALENGNTE